MHMVHLEEGEGSNWKLATQAEQRRPDLVFLVG